MPLCAFVCMSVCLCLFICLFICLFVDYLTFLFTWASCLIQRIHTYITLSSIIRYRFAVLLQNHFFRTAYIKQYHVCALLTHQSVSLCLCVSTYLSVCLSVVQPRCPRLVDAWHWYREIIPVRVTRSKYVISTLLLKTITTARSRPLHFPSNVRT